jgi:thioredoxin reductase (NADPH)
VQPDDDVDVIVIGAGPAGLTAALYLARFRRRLLLLDGGHSRATHIPRSRNYPGFVGGVPGTELVAHMRQQASAHGITPVPAMVDRLERLDDGRFRASWGPPAQRASAQARFVLLATGATDRPPPLPYLEQALQDGTLRYCPVCDGFETIGKSVGILTDHHGGVGEALYLRHYSDHVTLLRTSDAWAPTEEDRARLAGAGVKWVDAVVDSLRLWDNRVTARHGESETAFDTVYAAFGMVVHNTLATALGAECDRHGYLLTDAHHQTTVPGLYAAGDVCQGLNQIAVATGNAAIATSAIHRALGLPGSRQRGVAPVARPA